MARSIHAQEPRRNLSGLSCAKSPLPRLMYGRATRLMRAMTRETSKNARRLVRFFRTFADAGSLMTRELRSFTVRQTHDSC